MISDFISITNNLTFEKYCKAIKRYENKASNYYLEMHEIEKLFPGDDEILIAFDEDIFNPDSEYL